MFSIDILSILSWIGIVGLICLLCFAVLANRCGIFSEIRIRTDSPDFKSCLKMAYKFHVGEYRDVSKVMKELTAVAKNDNVNLLGIYYDEPKTVENCFEGVSFYLNVIFGVLRQRKIRNDLQ